MCVCGSEGGLKSHREVKGGLKSHREVEGGLKSQSTGTVNLVTIQLSIRTRIPSRLRNLLSSHASSLESLW